MVSTFPKKYSNQLIIIAFTFFYLLFPTHNSTTDAYIYAGNVKWNNDLFFPHHLLYNLPGRLIYSTFQSFGFEINVLQLMKILNAVVAGLALSVFLKIIKQLPIEKRTITGLLLIAGSSFVFLRFATENEAYVLPFFLSLLSSYYFLLFLNKQKTLLIALSGLFASLACIFHQIHIFWAFGLFIGLLLYKRKVKSILFFTLPALLIPLVYFIAFRYGNNDFMRANSFFSFVLFDYFYGIAHVQFNINYIVLGFINMIRSYVQVHGIIIILIKKFIFLIVVILFFAFFLIKALLNFKSTRIKKPLNIHFLRTHLIIFILQFAFAVFAGGNAEFMIMLPALSLLLITGYVNLSSKFYKNLGVTILIWNFSFAIFPNYFLDYQNNKQLINIIEMQPDDYFILSEDVFIQNKIYYHTGVPWNKHILKSPAGYKINGTDRIELRVKIDSLLNKKRNIYTDCINEPIIYNRAAYLSANENIFFFKNYLTLKTDSFQTLAGTKYIYRVIGQ
ncbi:MAG: hypothetical protein ABFS35_11290 [Bacteroidota bacterium]